MRKSKVICYIMIVILCLNLCGCSISIRSRNSDKKEANNLEKNEKDNKNNNIFDSNGEDKADIKKITVSFSASDKNHFKRQFEIVPNGAGCQCSYTSEYLEESLTSKIGQEDYDNICNTIQKFSKMKWKTDNLAQYDTQNYKTDKFGVCKVNIESSKYEIDATSDSMNLCKAFACQICNTFFPIDSWETKADIDMSKYYEISINYMKKEGSTFAKEFVKINYVASPNYFFLTDEQRQHLVRDLDKNQRYIEYIEKIKDETHFFNYNSMSKQRPLEYEFFSLFSKFDIDKMKNSNDNDNIKTNGKSNPIESCYGFCLRDKSEKMETYYYIEDNFAKSGQKEAFDRIVSWNEEAIEQFSKRLVVGP